MKPKIGQEVKILMDRPSCANLKKGDVCKVLEDNGKYLRVSDPNKIRKVWSVGYRQVSLHVRKTIPRPDIPETVMRNGEKI